MGIIKLENIKKTYGNGECAVEALKGIDLEIEEGESIAIMGTSGSGKSTLLNILGFVDEATEGTYLLDGTDSKKQSQKEKAEIRNQKLGFVVQDFALISRLSVCKNVMLPLEYVNMPKKEKERKVIELLEKLGISDKKNTYPDKLSGGQKQRVAIARALVNDASILLCDEPTGALDSNTTKDIMNLFMKLNRDDKKTLIIVTHDKDVAAYCERIIYMEDGRIEQSK